MYLFAPSGGNLQCDGLSIPFGTVCDSLNDWCLLKLTQPRTAVSASGIRLDFGGETGQCQIAGAIGEHRESELCDGSDNDCDGRIDERDPGAGVACESDLAGPVLPG